MNTWDIAPFRVDVDQEVLDDLRARLARTRWPDAAPGAPWAYGTDLAFVQELCEYWRDGFDWRIAEARLNAFPQYITEIDGQPLHFLHVRSAHAEALPLIVTHGWPGSVYEFHKIIGPLVDPTSYGGSPADAFHIVCPSMPGYGFSGPTRDVGWDTERIGRANAALMARLGYDRYGAQGGDWGANVSSWNAVVDAEHMVGVHLNLLIAGAIDRSDRSIGVEPHEVDDLAQNAEFSTHETGYQSIQGTKPQTLAYGLTDSPAGLAAWIVEKFRTWSDCGGDVEQRFSKDDLLTNITIYWVTGTINSSCRLYYESLGPGRLKRAPRVELPTGCAIFPKELYKSPRAWAEARYNIVHWQRYDSGGHFAAMEEPEALVGDIRSFFAKLR